MSKVEVGKNTISLWLRSVNWDAYVNTPEVQDSKVIVNGHEVRAISISLTFKRDMKVGGILNFASLRSPIMNFVKFHLRHLSHDYLNFYFIVVVVSENQILIIPEGRTVSFLSFLFLTFLITILFSHSS